MGRAVIEALLGRHGEFRAFVSDPSDAERLRGRGIKVAVGDVSDWSHVEGAAKGCFSAIVVAEAAFDGRERSFSSSPAATITGWVSALAAASVKRLIWIDDPRVAGAVRGFEGSIAEVAIVATKGRTLAEIAAEAARLDDLTSLDEV